MSQSSPFFLSFTDKSVKVQNISYEKASSLAVVALLWDDSNNSGRVWDSGHMNNISRSVPSFVCRISRKSCGSRKRCHRWFGSVPAPRPLLKLLWLTPTSLETSWRASLCAIPMSYASPVYQVSKWTCAHEKRIFLLMSVGGAFVLRSVELLWGTECFLLCDYICLCLGARETDYPAGEEVAPNSETGPAGDGSSQSTSSSSTGGDAILGGITVVGCDVEGAAAIPQTAISPGKDGETGQRC